MLFSAVPFKSSLSLSVSLSLTSCPSLGGAVAQQSCLTDSQPSSGARFAETPRPLRCLVVHGRRWRGQGRAVLVWSPRHQPQDGWARELASHREMVSSTRLAHLGSDQGPLPASRPVGVGGADCRAARSGSCCRSRGPLPAAGLPGIPRPLRWRRVPCLGPVARPVLGLQGALQMRKQEAAAQ